MNNLFMVIGRLTKDTELRYTKENKPVCELNIAVNNDKDDTTFLPITIFGAVAETTNKYCHKGDLISVTGLIKNNNYEDKDGNKRFGYSFIASRVTFLSTKKEDKEESKVENVEEFDPNEIVVTDDDLPF